MSQLFILSWFFCFVFDVVVIVVVFIETSSDRAECRGDFGESVVVGEVSRRYRSSRTPRLPHA